MTQPQSTALGSPSPVNFGPIEAAHLLGRLQFGVTPWEVDQAVRDGLAKTLDRLFQPQAESDEFRQAEHSLRDTAYATSSIDDLKSWWLYRMQYSANPLVEKLTLFWHNHFATSAAKVQSVPYMAAQNDLFRQYVMTPFGPLLHAIARDPAMLVWLDGNANRKRHPNENFAREVMELFALGIGNYTERDIQEAARAFSGWQLREREFWFNAAQHDATVKTIFGRTGAYTGTEVLDLCLTHPACPRYLATRLLRAFVTAQPTAEQVERTAELYRQHDLATGPVLRAWCELPEFYAQETRRSLIKSPLDFVLGSLRNVAERIHWGPVREVLARLGQDVFEPPSVKGWEGGRQWIQSTGWIYRWNFLSSLFEGDQMAGLRSRLGSGADDVVQRWEHCLLGAPVTADIDRVLRDALGSDRSDAESGVRRMLHLLMTLPDYQLM